MKKIISYSWSKVKTIKFPLPFVHHNNIKTNELDESKKHNCITPIFITKKVAFPKTRGLCRILHLLHIFVK